MSHAFSVLTAAGINVGGMSCIRYHWVTDFAAGAADGLSVFGRGRIGRFGPMLLTQRFPWRQLFQPKQPFVIAAFHRREAAEALKARNMIAQGKHAESVRRPG